MHLEMNQYYNRAFSCYYISGIILILTDWSLVHSFDFKRGKCFVLSQIFAVLLTLHSILKTNKVAIE